MKKLLILASMCAMLPAVRLIAEETNDANAVWERVLVLARTPPAGEGNKDADIHRLTTLADTAAAFWQARVDRDELKGQKPNLTALAADVREITGASAAPLGLRSEAAFWLVELYATAAAQSKDPAQLAGLDEQAAALVKQFPTSMAAARVPWVRMEVYEAVARANNSPNPPTRASPSKPAGASRRRNSPRSRSS